MDIPVIPLVTNKFNPTGGVTIPISIFTTIMIPKWIGSIPSWIAIGKKIGVKINKIAVGSIKSPAIIRMILTINKNIKGESPAFNICSDII